MTTRFSTRSFRGTGVRALLAVIAFTLLGSVVAAPLAHATPIDDERAKAQTLESSLNDTGAKLAGLYEQIKYNQDELDQAQQTIASTQADKIGRAHV